jgi:hypothetical protein
MAKRFQTVKRRARFSVAGYSANQMELIGQSVRDDIEQRILSARDVNDSPTPPLKNGARGNGYASQKARKAPPAIRNWKFTGRTLRSMKVLSAAPNQAKIGFTDAVANKRAFYNNRRWRQFGVSPGNRKALVQALRQVKFVSVKAA